jgi:uncharacterized protein (TIGR02646 family)
MRHIRKWRPNPDRHLSARFARPQQPQTADEARASWARLESHANVLRLLTEDQRGLCCYSEVRPDERGLGAHIEHVQPKSSYPHRTFDYQNLAMSSFHADQLGHTTTISSGDLFRGHFRRDQYDPVLFISPLDEDCSRYFTYLPDGQLVPATTLGAADQTRALYTINVLNLNCGVLQLWRRETLEALEQTLTAYTGSEEETMHVFLMRTQQQLQEFFSAVRQSGGPLAEEVLQREAPELR